MKSKNTIIGIFLLLFFVLLVIFNLTKPRIVVLHSSGKTLPWAVEMDAAMNAALANNRMPLSVQWHYMDLENKPKTEQRNVAAADAKRFISQINPDIVISVDDEANELVAKEYAGLDRPKVLYVSIDRKPEVYGYQNAKNVTGIIEKLPMKAIHEGLNFARPNKPATITAIAINNETGQAEMQQAKDFDWSPHQLATTQNVKNFEEWKDFVIHSIPKTDILLVFSSDGLMRSANDVQVISAKEITEWTEANSIPLPVGVNPSFIKNGGGLMFSTSANDYGQKAINMALEWLQNPNAKPPTVLKSEHFHVGIRLQSLQKRQVTLPNIYLETARIGGNYYP